MKLCDFAPFIYIFVYNMTEIRSVFSNKQLNNSETVTALQDCKDVIRAGEFTLINYCFINFIL